MANEVLRGRELEEKMGATATLRRAGVKAGGGGEGGRDTGRIGDKAGEVQKQGRKRMGSGRRWEPKYGSGRSTKNGGSRQT